MFHHDWHKIDAKLIDTRIIGVVGGADGSPTFSKYECVVEFTMPDGHPTRLTVKAPPIVVVLPAIGKRVPLLVRPDGTKAIFDRHDPRVNVNKVWKATEAADKARLQREMRPPDRPAPDESTRQ